MKRLLALVFSCVTTSAMLAQAPDLLNYQALARDSTGQTLPFQALSLKVSILSGSASGTAVFVEEHTVTTDGIGLFSVRIGDGSAITGTFVDITWSDHSHFLKTEIDVNGGTNYDLLGVTQLLSVPYALHAKTLQDVSFEDFNVIAGVQAGQHNTNTHNVMIGLNAGRYNEGQNNTFVGMGAGTANATGNQNVFLGSASGVFNSTGYSNTFAGFYAGRLNTVGSGNTFLGVRAGTSNTTASHNIFVGNNAGAANTTGGMNTFMGALSGRENTTGELNTFIGYFSARYLSSGDRNTFLGTYSGQNANGSGNVLLGYGAGNTWTGDDRLIIANATSAGNVLIEGDFVSGAVDIKGKVTSKSGGFEFPDGTVQTTAATPSAPVFSGCLANVSNTTLAHNAYTKVSFSNTTYEEGEFWDAAQPTRIVIPSGVSYIRLKAFAQYSSTTYVAGTLRQIAIRKNGTGSGYLHDNETSIVHGNHLHIDSPVMAVNPGDYFELQLYQNSGVTADISHAWLSIEVVK